MKEDDGTALKGGRKERGKGREGGTKQKKREAMDMKGEGRDGAKEEEGE